MAEDHRGRGLLPRERQEEPQYPPPPGEEDDRPRSYQLPPPPMSTGVTLPSMHDPYGPAGSSRYPPPDPRADQRARGQYSASPTSVNGFGPPQQQGGGTYLPPLHTPDQRQDQRQQYSNDGRDYYDRGQPPPQQQYVDVGPHRRAPYGAPDPYHPYNGYRPPPPGAYGGYDYRGQPPPQPQAAPRQRTSIACRYCRKRKIRCSGYQNTADGKCTNCKKTGNECVFQPVSSSTSTAFIPVSAVPGGVPPGTPLFGAFGQPLAPAHAGGAGPSQAPYATSSGSDYPLPSPTGSQGYYQHPDDRAQPGARRARPMDDEPGMRLPPPNPYPDEDRDPHRRRSPVSMQSNTPPTTFHQYQPRGAEYDDRTPTPRRNSPGSSSNTSATTGVMSLSNMMDQHAPAPRPQQQGDTTRDIDRNMLGRLNNRRP